MKKIFAFLLAFLYAFVSLLSINVLPVNAESEGIDYVYLSDIPYESGSVGWGSIQKDKSVDGNTLTLLDSNGQSKAYSKGLGVHASSEIVYNVENQNYQYFEANVGVDRENTQAPGSVVFKVYKDEVEVFKSGTFTKSNHEETIKVDITGAKKIKIVADDAGDGNNSDHADWCDAKFKYSADVLTKLSTLELKSGKKWLAIDDTVQTEAKGKLYNGTDVDFSTTGTIQYTSSNESAAKVSSTGLITAVANGITKITAEATVNGATKTSSINVIVGSGDVNKTWIVRSPDEKINMIVFEDGGKVYYTTYLDGKVVLEDSPMGIKLSDSDMDFTSGLAFKSKSEEAIDETYPVVSGNKSVYSNKANQSTITFTKGGKDVDIVVRAYNDGIAFRYALAGTGTKVVATESTGFKIPKGSTVRAMPYITTYEDHYFQYNSDAMNSGEYATTFLFKTPDNVWALLAEAEVNGNYCGSSIKPSADGLMNLSFTSLQTKAVTITLPFASPWRTAIIGTAATIAGSSMIENLNPACKIDDTSWIKPGVTSWTWFNGDSVNDPETYKRYIDLSAEMGWKYVLLDEGWQPRPSSAWSYSGWYDWVDDVIAYANQKNVGLFVWSTWWDLGDATKRERLAEWSQKGIKGIKVDFFDNETQDQMKIYDDIAQAALDNKLLVNFHGSSKPTGEERTWPHILTRESVSGEEHSGDKYTPTAEFDCTLPFTRNVLGGMDYTPIITHFRGVDNQTYAHFAALPVIFQCGVQCFADKPATIRASQAYDLFKDIPATWDDTKILEADPGKYVTMARKSGENWYVGGICNAAKTSDINLDFLDDGKYYATIYKDGANSEDILVQTLEVTKGSNLQIPMSLHGGYAMKITRASLSVPQSITLDKTHVTLMEKGTVKLTAQVNPSDAQLKALNWSSSNEAVATVSNGLITAQGGGTAIITATTVDGKVSVACEVTVKKAMPLANNWSVIRQSGPTNINTNGELTITTQYGDLYQQMNDLKNITLTSPGTTSDFVITTKLAFNPNQNYQSAGLVAYSDDDNFFSVLRRKHSGLGDKIFATVNEANQSADESGHIPDTLKDVSSIVYLKLVKSGTNFSGYYSADGNDWTQISTTKVNSNLGNSQNIKVGVLATNGGNPSATADAVVFSNFTINGNLVDFAKPDTAPVANDVTISGTAKVGETLTGGYTFTDTDSDTEGASTYKWMISDSASGSYTAIDGAVSKTYTPTADMEGKYLKFEVTPADIYGLTGTAVQSAATAAIEPEQSNPLQVLAPTASPAGGTYTSAQTVTLSSATNSASIYYTVDGSEPTTASAIYANPIAVNTSMVIKAIAVKEGMEDSGVAVYNYTIDIPQIGKVQMPTASPAGGTYTSTQTVTLSSTTSGASIYYTADGTEPTTASAIYANPITVNASMVIKAIAVKEDMDNSEIATFSYTINTTSGGGSEGHTGGGSTSGGSTSGGNTTGGSTVQETVITVTPEGNAKIKNSSTVINGAVVSQISEGDLDKALQKAVKASDGTKTVIVEMKEEPNALKYVQKLPVSKVVSESSESKIQIMTPVAELTVPSNMIKKVDAKDSKVVEIIFEPVKSNQLDKKIQNIIGNRPIVNLHMAIDGKIIEWNNPLAPVKVSMKYTPTAKEMENTDRIVVYYIDGNNNIITVPNGRYDTETGKITFKTTHFSNYAIGYSDKTFSDVADNKWYSAAIGALAAKGIAEGISDEEFSPGLAISREESIAWLVRTLELNAETNSGFDDTSDSKYSKEINIAKALGITNGVGGNKFAPKRNITRQDLMKMIVKAMDIANKSVEKGAKQDIAKFKDVSEVSSYALESVAALVKSGIVAGSGENINPKQSITRAETAAILYKIYNK